MKQFAWYFFKVAFISFLILETIGFSLLFSFKSTSFYKSNLPYVNEGKHYDFIILGSSRGLTSIDTKTLSSCAQQKGFNFSVDDTHVGSHLLMLKHLLHYNITCDTVFLVYENQHSRINRISSNDYRFLPFIDNDYVSDYYREKNAPRLMLASKFFPFVSLAYYNVELFYPSLLAVAKRDVQYRYDDFGDYSYPNTQKVDAGLERSVEELNFDVPELQQFSKICLSRNIKLILIIAPSYHTMYQPVGNVLAYDIVDLSNAFDDSTLFYDRIHVNAAGKEVLTKTLCERMRPSLSDETPR